MIPYSPTLYPPQEVLLLPGGKLQSHYNIFILRVVEISQWAEAHVLHVGGLILMTK